MFRVQLNVVPFTLPLITIVVMALPEQMAWLAGVATAFGVGLTSTVAVIGVPGQLLAVGVMVKVTVIGALVVLVKAPLMLPAPLAAIPVTVATLSRVQLKVVPFTLPAKTMVVMLLPEQMVCAAGVAVAFGVGFTTTVAVMGSPVQVGVEGIIVKVTVTGALVVLVNAPLILPNPEAAIPVTETVLLRVQLNVVLGSLLVRTMVVISFPEQIVCAAGLAVTSGVGLTVTVPHTRLDTHGPL